MTELFIVLLTGATIGIMATLCVIFVFFMGVRITINVTEDKEVDDETIR